MGATSGLRERKKQQTRTTLVREGLALIARDGYENVTSAAIAEVANVSRATFFNYFSSKDDLVLAHEGAQHRAFMAEAITRRTPGVPASEALLTGVRHMVGSTHWPLAPGDELTEVRIRLITQVPQLRAAYLARLADLQEDWTELLVSEYHDQISRTDAAILVGALTGAVTHAVFSHLRHDGTVRTIADVVEHAARTTLIQPSKAWHQNRAE